MSDLETETTSDEATFEMFGRTWSVPAKRHHAHIRRSKAIIRTEGYLDVDDIAQIYLSPEQYDDLLTLDVAEQELTKFANAISKALGIGNQGNS